MSIYKQQQVPEDKAFLSSDSAWHSWDVLSHSPRLEPSALSQQDCCLSKPFFLWRAEPLPVAVPSSCCSRLLSPAVTLPALCQAQLYQGSAQAALWLSKGWMIPQSLLAAGQMSWLRHWLQRGFTGRQVCCPKPTRSQFISFQRSLQ